MILYSVSGNNTKIHVTDNYLLAQLVAKDLKEDGFEKVGICQYDSDKIHFYIKHSTNNIDWVSLCAGSLKFSIHKENWDFFKESIFRWDKKQKDKGRCYYKLYGMMHILCLTRSQRMALAQYISQKGEC